MTNGELINMMVSQAKMFRDDRDWLKRNDHMHNLPAEEFPTIEQVDAILIGFINHVGMARGMDVGLYAMDLRRNT